MVEAALSIKRNLAASRGRLLRAIEGVTEEAALAADDRLPLAGSNH